MLRCARMSFSGRVMGHVHIHEQLRVWIVVSSRSIVSIGLCCCGWLAGWCKCDEKGRIVHFIICCSINPFNSLFLNDLSPSTYTSPSQHPSFNSPSPYSPLFIILYLYLTPFVQHDGRRFRLRPSHKRCLQSTCGQTAHHETHHNKQEAMARDSLGRICQPL